MGIAKNKDLVAQHVCRAFRRHAEGYLVKFADDVRIHADRHDQLLGTCNGKQKAIVMLLGPLTPQLDGLTITPDNTIAEGDYVVVQARSHGRVKSGGT